MTDQSARLEALKEQVERASALIGELRETNYSLTTELVELRNRMAAEDGSGRDGGDGEPGASGAGTDSSAERAGHASQDARERERELALERELELLRTERETVRKTLRTLISRIDKLES